MANTRTSDFCAFILAAGEGRRLRPYTDEVPKPLVPVNGQPILEHALSRLEQVDIRKVVINTFYKGDVIKNFIKERSHKADVFLSEETELLNTGLGVKRALSQMGEKPFFLINGDAFWTNGPDKDVFSNLADYWRPEDMDILLLLQPVKEMHLTKGVGDYVIDESGRAVRQKDQSGDYMFAGIRICKPEVFDQTPDTPFGFLDLMDKAEQEGRLYGLVHDGDWHHISTPKDLDRVNQALSAAPKKEACA